MWRFLWLALLWLLITACTPTAETAVSPSPSSQTTVLPTATFPPPVVASLETPAAAATAVPDPTQPADANPTAEPTPAEESAVEEVRVISGRTDEGAFFLGDPNAPITHIDYSDFL
ncbi:MAG: hypothetical protein IPM53_21665 [Anaerolineaceae bacterium]|nr:hypothetical protein [Anaerolineaceae bacterium]